MEAYQGRTVFGKVFCAEKLNTRDKLARCSLIQMQMARNDKVFKNHTTKMEEAISKDGWWSPTAIAIGCQRSHQRQAVVVGAESQ
ncbi:hypothetical protein PIB30_047106 [Stylosanthes scabra]|uniref:Uncharacterized protein n=1 Tax=Stylosanthes scabra TaxID=79078 RepID=A0ABU6QGL4_9FABA|nr:hypothetical protein [Stylosanthes scabra]